MIQCLPLVLRVLRQLLDRERFVQKRVKLRKMGELCQKSHKKQNTITRIIVYYEQFAIPVDCGKYVF